MKAISYKQKNGLKYVYVNQKGYNRQTAKQDKTCIIIRINPDDNPLFFIKQTKKARFFCWAKTLSKYKNKFVKVCKIHFLIENFTRRKNRIFFFWCV